MEFNAGGSLPAVVLGLLVLGAVAYVVLRSLSARNRGDDPMAAAADALREVGPPVIALGCAVIVASALSVVAIIMVFFGLFSLIAGDDDVLTGGLVLLMLSGFALFVGAGGAVWWAVSRIRGRR